MTSDELQTTIKEIKELKIMRDTMVMDHDALEYIRNHTSPAHVKVIDAIETLRTKLSLLED